MIKRLNTDSLLSKIRIVDEERKALPFVKAVAACFSEPSLCRNAEEYHRAEQHGFYAGRGPGGLVCSNEACLPGV